MKKDHDVYSIKTLMKKTFPDKTEELNRCSTIDDLLALCRHDGDGVSDMT